LALCNFDQCMHVYQNNHVFGTLTCILTIKGLYFAFTCFARENIEIIQRVLTFFEQFVALGVDQINEFVKF